MVKGVFEVVLEVSWRDVFLDVRLETEFVLRVLRWCGDFDGECASGPSVGVIVAV